MSDFHSAIDAHDQPALDPSKHVNFVHGMVLGVDDFRQEFAYLVGRDRWALRDLHGYGTVWGLPVTVAINGDRVEVKVDGGVAVTPRGDLVRVPRPQCAELNQWLSTHEELVNQHHQTGPDRMMLHVVLCYRECLTDKVLIPGEPCRDEESLRKDSRVADDYHLELRVLPPQQIEADATADFLAWLRSHLEVTAPGGTSAALEDVLAGMRSAALGPPPELGSPPGSPPPGPTDYMIDTSPPTAYAVAPEDLAAYLQAIFRVWATELRGRWRPSWLGDRAACDDEPSEQPSPTDADCVLLASLEVPIVRSLSGPWEVDDPPAEVAVDESRRPILLPSRMLQQLALGEWAAAAGGGGGGVLPAPPIPIPLGGRVGREPAPAPAPAPSPYRTVAAGTLPLVRTTRAPAGTFGGLRISAAEPETKAAKVAMTFDQYVRGNQYVVKPLLWPDTGGATGVTFEGFDRGGFVLRVAFRATPGEAELAATRLMVEVSEITAQ